MSLDKPRMVFQEDLASIEEITLSMFDLADRKSVV